MSNPSEVDTELVLAFMDVDAARELTHAAKKRADNAVAAARAAGYSAGRIAKIAGRDRTTIQKRAGARLTEQDNEQ